MKLKIVIVWLAILLFASFLYSMLSVLHPLSMVVHPEVPRQGEPIVVTFSMRNTSPEPSTAEYWFYANGELLNSGTTTVFPSTTKTYRYAYNNPLELGEQVNFLVKTQSELGNYEKTLSSPPYPPQIWSSFVSFASFSTSVMSSFSSMTYYQSTFATDTGFNVGLLSTIVLIALLIFLELTQPLLQGKTIALLGRLRLRFSTVTWILFIIFIGMIFTQIVLVITN